MLNFSIKEWDEAVGQKTPSPFSQAWSWAEFQKRVGRQRFFIKNSAGQALLIKCPLPLGQNYLYSPRGPILNTWNEESFRAFLSDVRTLTAKEKSIFWRFDPPILSKDLKISHLQKVADVQPVKTIIVDLFASEEEMLGKMHYKTRYNIRLAQRHQITIREGRSDEIEHFIRLIDLTSQRDDFRSHSDDYYRQMLSAQSPSLDDFYLKLLLAEYQGQVLVANLVVFFGNTVTYLHCA